VSILAADTIETFSYLTSDGRSETEGLLAFAIDAPTPLPAWRPTAVNDVVEMDADADLLAFGNVLANDYDMNGEAIYLRAMGSTKVADHQVNITGMYGSLGFTKNGDYRYELDQSRIYGLDGVVRETFYYKISDGALQDTAALHFLIDLQPQIAAETDPFGLG
jgi:hypothetical protein